MLNYIAVLDNIIPVMAYDLQLKQELSLGDTRSALSNYLLLQKDFMEYFPHAKHPIRCNDVFVV